MRLLSLGLITSLALGCTLPSHAQSPPAESWRPAEGRLMTRWAKDVTPDKVLPEYPRPQLVRKDWHNLNGLWDYAIQPKDQGRPERWGGTILVPFPAESALSGVMKPVRPDERLWYRRTFATPKQWSGKRVLLHFGAVDFEAAVFVNGKEVGSHRGGFDPFSFDVTDALKPDAAEQELVVSVWDPTDQGKQPRGKQVLKPGGIMYTAVTGIWQTVWLEPVPESHVRSVKIVPDVDAGRVRFELELTGKAASLSVGVEGHGISKGKVFGAGGGIRGRHTASIEIDQPKLWSPDAPNLYDVRISYGDDELTSYFGMRKVSIGKDGNGVTRLLLNNQFVFQYGPLDQGWWPDGLYTAPTDEALKYDIEVTKQLGFNMARKHVKVEPARWYYWADKLGLIVWQDMPSGDRGIGANDPDLKKDPEAAKQFELELARMIDALGHFPSIVMWVPFNEGWGQYDTARIVDYVEKLDPSRLVNNASGWTDRGVGDVHDWHVYPGPGSPMPSDKRAAVLGEFGGLGLPVEGHTWQAKDNWGYRSFTDPKALEDAYVNLLTRTHRLIGEPGLSAAVYTQTTDVEVEVNGLLTYDRAKIKVDVKRVADAARALHGPPPKVVTLVHDGRTQPLGWRYTTEKPADGWEKAEFDDASWKTGKAGFGEQGTPNTVVRTEWLTPDIWVRRSFDLPQDFKPHNPHLAIHHDEDAEVYLNGVLAAKVAGYTSGYEDVTISREAAATLKPGKNVIAIHCRQTRGGQYIDAGIVDLLPAEAAGKAGATPDGQGGRADGKVGNPVLPGWYADPEGVIFGDRYWIYPTFSARYEQQVFIDAFSSTDLKTWTKHERIIDTDRVKWAKKAMWAPSVVEKDGKYYLFFAANDIQNNNEVGGIGVAVADRPEGPFKDHLGKPLVDKFHNGAQPIDQYVFKDVDGAWYMIYGGWRHCNIVRLNDDFTRLIPHADGTTYKEITPAKEYVEGPTMFRRNGKLYFMWSEGGWTGPDYRVAYAVADSPLGPFKRVGVVLQQDPAVGRGAGHHSVIHVPGTDEYYAVYHRRPLDRTDRDHRATCIDRMTFNPDGTIQPITITHEGVEPRPLGRAAQATASGPAGLVPLGATPLPLGSIKPAGWLKRQLEIQAKGLGGWVGENWPDVANSQWVGGKAEGWERGPYWLDGFIPLAIHLDDPKMKALAKKWVDHILASQNAENGWIGPVADNPDPGSRLKGYDAWPRMIVLKALTQWYEATGDERVIPAMTRFLKGLGPILDQKPLTEWARMRWADLSVSIYWLHDRTPEPWLLDLAAKVRAQGLDWAALSRDFPHKDKVTHPILEGYMRAAGGVWINDRHGSSHGVNVGMGVKAPGVWYRQSHDPSDLKAVHALVAELDEYHGQATGMFSCDEHLAGRHPSQGTELCTVVELMYSLETLLAVKPDVALADRLESVAYNALPATFTDDMWAHQYDQQANQVVCKLSEPRIYSNNGPDANLFGKEPHFGCCLANFHQGWPKLVSHLWMKTGDGKGLQAMAYAPCEVKTKVGDADVTVNVRTDYPFSDTIEIDVTSSKPAQFPVLLRIPEWAEGATAVVGNSSEPSPTKPGTFLPVIGQWAGKQTIKLVLPMKLRTERRFNDAVTVKRGPLVFALNVGQDWRKLRGQPPTIDYEVHPTTPWNYALSLDPASPESSLKVETSPLADVPFSREAPAVRLVGKARRVKDWELLRNAADVPPVSPVKTDAPLEDVTLVPYGSAKLRVTEIPVLAR